MQAGDFIVVYNFTTLIAVRESLDAAVEAAEAHSCQVPRGKWHIYRLEKPKRKGNLGPGIDWD